MGLILMALFFVAMFFILGGIFKILAWLAPVLIVLAVIINYRTVINYGKTLWSLLRRNPLMGILGVVLTVIAFPVVSAYLFGRSLFDRKLRRLEQDYTRRKQGEFVDYEEIVEDDDHLELPELKRRQPRSRDDDYIDWEKP